MATRPYERIVSMAELKRHERWTENIVSGLIVCIVWAGFVYLAYKASSWYWPVFYGAIPAGVALLCCFGFILVKRIPAPRGITSSKNIESCVRAWLDNHRIAVKNDPDKDLHFRFRITLDSGKSLTVLRSKTEFPEYVQIITDLGIRGEDQKLLDQFTDQEKTQAILEIQLELARAKVGYSGLMMPPENFFLFRRVPIFPGLSEFIFIAMVSDIEAAMNLVGNVYLKARLKAEERTGAANAIMLPSTSDTPKPALPPA